MSVVLSRCLEDSLLGRHRTSIMSETADERALPLHGCGRKARAIFAVFQPSRSG